MTDQDIAKLGDQVTSGELTWDQACEKLRQARAREAEAAYLDRCARVAAQPPCGECDGRGTVLDAPANVLDGRPYWVPCPKCQPPRAE